jgi:starch synthase
MRSDLQLVVLGTGHAVYHEFLQKAQHAHPQKIRACLKFDNHLAHVIEAGADAFLMPSRYEPCGLNQLYSLKYGTVPVARHTGGLADTINAATAATIREGTATGFVFDHYGARELTRAVRHALEVFRDHPDDWKKIQQAGMQKDFSWSRSAGLYERLFSKMLSEPRVKHTPPAVE